MMMIKKMFLSFRSVRNLQAKLKSQQQAQAQREEVKSESDNVLIVLILHYILIKCQNRFYLNLSDNIVLSGEIT